MLDSGEAVASTVAGGEVGGGLCDVGGDTCDVGGDTCDVGGGNCDVGGGGCDVGGEFLDVVGKTAAREKEAVIPPCHTFTGQRKVLAK